MSVVAEPGASYVIVFPTIVAVPPCDGAVTDSIVNGSPFASESAPFPLSSNTANEFPDEPVVTENTITYDAPGHDPNVSPA